LAGLPLLGAGRINVVADSPCGHVRTNVDLPLGAGVPVDADAGTLDVIKPSCLPRARAAH
jgi:muramoyltetrapeptide carboxypeptidase LdcA involved in peptidoglycan recycling